MVKYSKSDVEKMWKRPYEEQLDTMDAKIVEAFSMSDGGKLFVAFSGGKDSTFLLYHVARNWSLWKSWGALKEQFLNVVFTDTTVEYVGMRKFVRWYVQYLSNLFNIEIKLHETKPQNKQTFVTVYREIGIPLISKQVSKAQKTMKSLMMKNGILYEDILPYLERTEENVKILQDMFNGSKQSTLYLLGYTSSIGKFGSEYKIANKWIPLLREDAPTLTDECCSILKHGNIPEEFDSWVNMTGEMAEESRRRLQAYQQTGCNEDIVFGKGGKSKPMGPMTLQTELRNIKELGIPIFKYYGEIIEENGLYKTSGMYRTGCALCGFGIEFEPDRFIRLNSLEPSRVKFAFRDKEKGGLGYRKAFEFCNEYCGTKWGIPDTGE